MGTEQTYTPGPWHWRTFGSDIALTTVQFGSLIVMDFQRKGMRGAEPRFGIRKGSTGGLMKGASDLEDVSAHPDARLIAAAPELYVCLTHCLARLLHGPNANSNDGLTLDVQALIKRVEGGAA